MSYIYCVKCALDPDVKEHKNAYFVIDGISVCTTHFYEKAIVGREPFVVKNGKLEYKNNVLYHKFINELGKKDD